MKTITFQATMLLAGIILSCTQQTSMDPSLADPANDGRLWYEKPFRLVQTNLREIDAITLDPEDYVSMIKDFKATAALFNVGGIVANYPSELEFEYVNPNLREDMVGRVLEGLHKEGIAMMGRFDFSKMNEKYAFQNPDWLYKNVKGEYVNYNGQVHTCINGPYQQEYAREVGPAGIFAPLKSVVMALGYCYATHKRVYPITYAIFKAIRGSSRAKKDNGAESKASYRLGFDDMRAKLAYLNLERVDEIINRREILAESFLADDALSAVISLPVVAEHSKAVFIKLPFRPKRLHRAFFYEQCKGQGVDLEYLFPYHYGDDQSGFPNARTAAEQGMALPMYSRLMTRTSAESKVL